MQAQKDPQAFAVLEHNLAIAISEQRRYARGARSVRRSSGATRRDCRALAYNRGNTLQSMGRFTDAEAAYREALARDPVDLKAHTSLTQLLYRQGREDFLSSYDQAMVYPPRSSAIAGGKGAVPVSLRPL